MLACQARIARLKGVLIWGWRTQYDERLTAAHQHLKDLNESIDKMMAQYTAFVRARQAAVHSYMGYDDTLTRLRTRVAEGLQKVDLLQAQQGHLIEMAAVDELKKRRERLVAYQTYARYAVADSYDRANGIQSDQSVPTAKVNHHDDATPTGGMP
jgi:hypothetical protein